MSKLKRGGMKNPIFEPIEAPCLTSLVPKDVAEFFMLRKQYIRKIEERRATHNERISPTSLLLSIEPKLLQVICELRIRDVKEDDVTDDHLQLYLEKLMKPKDVLYDIEKTVKDELKYDLTIPDADARLMKLFMDFNEISRKYALGEVFRDEPGQKLKSKLIVETLRPESVRTMAETALKYKHREARKDTRELFDVLLRIVSNQDEIHRATRPKAEKMRGGSTEAKKPNAGENQKPKAKPDTPPNGCLKCKGSHWLAKCPKNRRRRNKKS